jgi:hypothetical protein
MSRATVSATDPTPQTRNRTIQRQRTTRHAPATVRAVPLDLPVQGFPVVNPEQQAAYDWLLARLFGPMPTPPAADDPEPPTHLPAARQGEAAGR